MFPLPDSWGRELHTSFVLTLYSLCTSNWNGNKEEREITSQINSKHDQHKGKEKDKTSRSKFGEAERKMKIKMNQSIRMEHIENQVKGSNRRRSMMNDSTWDLKEQKQSKETSSARGTSKSKSRRRRKVQGNRIPGKKSVKASKRCRSRAMIQIQGKDACLSWYFISRANL